jgi:hypothetical protein
MPASVLLTGTQSVSMILSFIKLCMRPSMVRKRSMRFHARILRALSLRAGIGGLTLLNRLGKSPAVSRGGPVVSLTSYGKRINTVHLVIESIARGTLLPSALILWLDDEMVFRNLPAPLRQLTQRGMEVRLTRNDGPHKKYYPYVEANETFDVPLVTADDDALYPPEWLECLDRAFREHPDVVNCYRARVIGFENNGLSKYEHWKMCESTEAGFRHFATGVSGVIYPPKFLAALKEAGRAFEHCCPKADDIWLHAQALRAGFKVRQLVASGLHFPMLPGTQEESLQNSNVGGIDAGNDRQMRLTYKENDLEILRGEIDRTREVMRKPLVSILINNFNYALFLGEAIDSALWQTYDNFEVIVVDDGSTDGSREIIRRYSDRIVEVLKENGGQASAFNAGFEASRGEILCFLDADDIFLPEKLGRIVGIFQENPAIGWCFDRVIEFEHATGERIPPAASAKYGLWDARKIVATGAQPYVPTATSGLSFRRGMLAQVLPMPDEIRITSDGYLKLCALGLAEGWLLPEELSLQRIHCNNAYTRQVEGRQRLVARTTVLTSVSLYERFGVLRRVAIRMLAYGLGMSWITGGLDLESQERAKSFLRKLTLRTRVEVLLRSAYWTARHFLDISVSSRRTPVSGEIRAASTQTLEG